MPEISAIKDSERKSSRILSFSPACTKVACVTCVEDTKQNVAEFSEQAKQAIKTHGPKIVDDLASAMAIVSIIMETLAVNDVVSKNQFDDFKKTRTFIDFTIAGMQSFLKIDSIKELIKFVKQTIQSGLTLGIVSKDKGQIAFSYLSAMSDIEKKLAASDLNEIIVGLNLVNTDQNDLDDLVNGLRANGMTMICVMEEINGILNKHKLIDQNEFTKLTSGLNMVVEILKVMKIIPDSVILNSNTIKQSALTMS